MKQHTSEKTLLILYLFTFFKTQNKMSVLILDTPQINYIRAGIERAAYNTQVNEWYYYCIASHMRNRDIETESLRLARSWAALNDKSYSYKYKETYTDNTDEIQAKGPFKPLNPVQLLKYVQCLIYNIEPEHFAMTEQEQADYDLLKKLELNICTAIIGNTQEYKDAQWC
jgi:hypothetical protein